MVSLILLCVEVVFLCCRGRGSNYNDNASLVSILVDLTAWSMSALSVAY
jgi:hypothetical protein